MTKPLSRLANLINPFVLLFLLTAWYGTQTAYAPQPAQQKYELLVVAVGVYIFVALLPAKRLPWLLVLLSLVSIGAAAHFWLAHDWLARPVKFGMFNAVGVAWQEIRPKLSIPNTFNGNVQGGIAAAFLPFLLIQFKQTRNWLVRLLLALPTLFVLVTIVFASSRGAWLALAGWSVVWLVAGRLQPTFAKRPPRLVALSLGLLAFVALIFVLFGEQLSASFNFASRLGLYASTIHLISDFPLVGAGLDTFRGLYSYYIYVTPHLVLTNAHNLWLDVWVEQGVLGSVALLGIFATAFWQLISAESKYKWVILTSGGILLTHSQIEDLTYGTAYTPLLFLTPALAMVLARPTLAIARRRWIDQLIIATVVSCVMFVIYPNAWEVNQAAIEQARIDLVGYPTGEWDKRLPEAWRGPRQQWRDVLKLDESNRSANHRLGLIALQGRQFENAAQHLEIALAETPQHRGIQKTLGYALTWSGRPDDGLRYLQMAEVNSAELFAYGGWWQILDQPELADLAFQLSAQLQQQESQ